MISNQRYSERDYSTYNFQSIPKELILEIISFLVGDLDRLHDRVDMRLVSQVENYIPPFENIKSVIRFGSITRRLREMIVGNGDEAFERFWLKGFVFHQKIMYWIRTNSFDSLDLCQGDLNTTEMDEALRLEVMIAAIERGKTSQKLDFDTISSIITDPLHMNDYCDEDACKEMIQSRLNRFNISFEDYELYYKNKEHAFEMFLTQSLMLSLEMYKYMHAESLSDYWSVGENFLLSENHVENWPIKSFSSRVKSVVIGRKQSGKSLGIRIESSIGWEYFVKNIEKQMPFTGMHPKELSRNIQSNDGIMYAGLLTIALLSYWNVYSLLASPLLLLLKNEDFTQVSNGENVETNLQIDEEKESTNKEIDETINLNELKERLLGSICLSLINLLYLDPLKDFEFPSNIRFLSIEYNNLSAYSKHPQNRWGSFFNGCTFPGVKYLRIVVEDDDGYRDNESVMKIGKISRTILESMLSCKVMPNLKYLVLSGFHENEYLFHQIDFLKQLYNIDIVFDYNSRHTNGWLNMTEFTSRLSQVSKTLKYVVVETNTDPRPNGDIQAADHRSIKEFYDSHDNVASLGTFSISRYYYSCNE